MISATALSASTVPLNKSPQMPLGLDNSRLRVDSQKFLVPSLPVSSRPINPRADHHNHHHNPHLHYQQQHNGGSTPGDPVGVNKRRERSILNGTAHPISPQESRLAGAHSINGLRRSTSPLGGKGSSPNYPHMQCSPRKDAHSPMYAGEVPGFSGSPGSTYSARSSVPIPCSSPSPGSSASPKSSHSLSPNSSSSNYSSHLPPGLSSSANGASELSQLAVAAAAAAAATGGRLYPPGFPPPSAAHHAAFYAAAAAAAGHSLPYPSLFGSHYPQHQHPAAAAAASSYLDFHSKLLRNSAAAVAAELRSPSQSPPSRSYQPASPQQQQQPPPHILQPLGSPQSTSVTSLHTKLIESVSATGDRFHPHHSSHNHNHIHSSGSNSQQHGSSLSRFASAPAGVSKGGPLGISGGIMGLSISPNSQKGHAGHTATSSASESNNKSGKLYMEHPGIPGSSSSNSNSNNSCQQERNLLAEMELINGNKTKEAVLAKHRMLTRSPEDYTGGQQQHQPPQKMAKSISFASDVHSGGIHRAAHHSYMNGHGPHPPPHQMHHPQHTQGHHHSSSAGPTNLSTDSSKRVNGNTSHTNSSHHHTATSQHHQNHLFLPPSPKKRSAHWNFAVPHSPINNGKMGEHFAPPPPPSSDSMSDSSLLNTSPSKYLSQTQQNQKPSDGNNYSHNHNSLQPFLSGSKRYFPFHDTYPVLNSNETAPVSNSDFLASLSHSTIHPQHQKLRRFNANQLFYDSSAYISSGGPGPTAMANGSGTALAATGNHYQSTNAQQLLVVPSSPLSSSPSSHSGSGPSTPKSPSVHFKFFSSTNKENNGATTSAPGRNGKVLNARNDSSSSTSSLELGVINGNGKNRQNGNCGPWPVEQMPLISAFRKGSMIKLASGDMKAVEDLKEEDFEKAVQMMSDSVKIVYCPVISIQENADSSVCVVTLAMGAAHNQQVVVEATPEQPFFIRGRGWSSSSPKLTEKILHLSCTMLTVGDICITLTRHVKKQANNASSGGTGSHHPTPSGRGAKSKAGATRPYGTYAKSRNASTSSILKSSHQLQQRSNNSVTNGTRMNGRKLVSGPATNLDVNTSSTTVSSAVLTTTSNSISKQTEKVSSASDKEERQDKTTEEKEVNLSVANSNVPTTSSAPTSVAIRSDYSCSSNTTITTPINSGSRNNASPGNSSDSKDQSEAKSAAPAAILSYKRKSISPCPVGSPVKKEDETRDSDTNGGAPSPKKRRWSAPDQIEVESQQNIPSGEGASSIVKADVTFTSSKSLDASALAFVSRGSSNVRKEESEGQKNTSEKLDGNKNCVELESCNSSGSCGNPNDRKSSYVPPSKSLTSMN
ncbi:unnamed protein product [Orchesella dallaii]|uniref:AXH domain-containing protein n=1 Tax=Orchesella dallaii TaxID=48710 RepID=A0ABP1QF72_9HEXA